MTIQIDTATIHKSFAQILAEIDKTATIYDNPNQQATKLPAWFIVHREPVRVERENKRRTWLVYSIDIYYMVEYNLPSLYDIYRRIAEALDLQLTYLPIYGYEGACVHVLDRSWEVALNAMKYSTTLRLHVSNEIVEPPYMRVIEDLWVFLKTHGHLYRVHFANTLHPELSVDLPPTQFAYYGGDVVLPSLQVTYWDSDGTAWVPRAWTLGAFGESVGPIYEDVTTDLLWKHPSFFIVFDNESNRILYELQDMQDMEFTGTGHTVFEDKNEVVTSGTGHVVLENANAVAFVEIEPEPYDTLWFSADKSARYLSNTYVWPLYDNSGNNMNYDSRKTYTIIGTNPENMAGVIMADSYNHVGFRPNRSGYTAISVNISIT